MKLHLNPRGCHFVGFANVCLLLFLLISLTPSTFAQDEPDSTKSVKSAPLNPPTNIEVSDTPNDAGGSITIQWTEPIPSEGKDIKGYRIFRAESVDGKPGKYKMVGSVVTTKTRFKDGNVDDDLDYFYQVAAVYTASVIEGQELETLAKSRTSSKGNSSAQWFDFRRVNVFVGVILLCGFILYYISRAKAGEKLFIRKIAGLEAVDEAVGRATEMGKKIFFIPGINDMNDVQTIAGVSILGRVAEVAATYETYIEVPVARSLVLVTAKEVVKEAYSKVGRPEAFHEDQVHYLTDDQFGYAAGIDGMVVREEPATIFFMGAFYAESLILSETGNSIGAIQIAGTAMPAQLPFFVAACDYTLIGEELFAASAYLSREPKLLGSLKGQDMGKAIVLVAIIIGILLETFNIWDLSKLFKVTG
ncbi:MAG: fibronectin type III domain-containing protein [candidate division Zixibacteria bacterium]|nr:fibronectin type III domain-containing protein [candidate division Zixibacteria bacterium]